MPTTYAFVAAKGGQGTTVTATATALIFANSGARTLLVDAAEHHDCNATLGMPEPSEPHVAVHASPNLELVAADAVADIEADRFDIVIVDAGQRAELTDTADVTVLVTRPCYLALRRALATTIRPSTIVVIAEERRALHAADIAAVLGVDEIITVRHDPAVARTVDAGLLAARTPSALDQLAVLLVPAPN